MLYLLIKGLLVILGAAALCLLSAVAYVAIERRLADREFRRLRRQALAENLAKTIHD